MGRTKLGNVLFAQRVPPELAVKLKAYVADWKARGGVVPPSASNGLESKGNGVGGPVYHKVLGGAVQVDPFYKGAASFKELADVKTPPITQDHLPLLKRIMELESQLSQMTASYEGEYKRAEDLVIDLGNLKDDLEQVAGWSEDEKTKYWRNRALQAELTLKGKTNEFDQG